MADVTSAAARQYKLQSIVPTIPQSLQDTSSASSNPQEDFLKLMVAQIQNQDPDKPTDGTALISQLTEMNAAFAVQRMSFLTQATQQITTSAALLGRNVEIKNPDTGALVTGKVATVDYSGADPAVVVNGAAYPLTAVNRIDV